MNNVVVGEDIILPRSYRSPPHIRLSSFLIVGATIGRPSSLRLQIALPSVAKTKISISPVGVDVLDDPRKIKIKAKISIENPF